MVAGIVSYAREHGPWEFIGQVGPTVEAVAIERAPPFDGVIFHQMQSGAAEAVLKRGAPAVSVGGDMHTPLIPHVTADSPAIASMAFQHFRELGFERFAVYGGNPAVRERRIDAFRALAESAGYGCVDLGPGSRHQWLNANENLLWTREVEELKRALPKLGRPVALFTWSTEEARPVVAACDEVGIKVPDEIAVLGVDDDEAVCELANPPISAIDHGCETIGWEAAKTLDMLMRGQRLKSSTIHVTPLRVVVRQSTNTLAVDDRIVVAALRFIQANFAEPITAQDIMQETRVSRPTLEQHMRRALGHSVHRQITLVRIKHAKELLQATRLDLSAISVRCGFSYPSKFSAVFRREVGLSPSAYRERHLIRRRL